MRRALLVLLAVAALGGAAGCGDRDDGGGPLVGERPPSLESAEATWLGTKEPLVLEALRGRVVYLEFGFLH